MEYQKQNWWYFKPASKVSNIVLSTDALKIMTSLSCLFCWVCSKEHSNCMGWKDQATVQSVVDILDVFQCSLEINPGHCNHGNSFESTSLVCDTDVSLGLTPYRADFLEYVEVIIQWTKSQRSGWCWLSSCCALLITSQQLTSIYSVCKHIAKYTSKTVPSVTKRLWCI